MYNFDKLLTDFILTKKHVHEEDFSSVYDEWYNSFCSDLGCSPSEAVANMTDDMLICELKEECKNGTPSLTVMENLEKRAPVEKFRELLYEKNNNVVYCAAELLRNIDSVPYEIFAQLLPQTDDSDLFELIVSELKRNPETVRERLYELANGDMRVKTVIAEILIEGKMDDRTFNLLTELFASGENIALYANYLGRYGDDRAAAMLYRALDTASYADYIEIRNAIEMLGGVVDEDLRDFSSDSEYKIIKERKNEIKI